LHVGDNDMAFTRDELTAYEKGPQKEISDKVNPFRGATPAQAANAAAVAAVAAGNIDATPGGAPAQAAANTDPLTDDSPVVDEDGTLGDPTDSGEGTSQDENSEDSSNSAVEPGDESDPNTDLTGDEEPAKPKKGSAAERIVEVLDLAEGYKEYGKLKDAENQDLRERLAALEGRGAAPATAAAPPAPIEDEPMPDMSDEDVAFDNDKYRAKMAKWVKGQVASGARAAVREVTGAEAATRAMQAVETKVETFAKDHADFDTVVRKNKVLAQNPLGPDAGLMIQESDFTAELLYQFGKDPGLAIRTARMTPRQQVAQVTRMIVALEEKSAAAKGGKNPAPQGGAKPAQKKSITQAPPPPRPTQGGGRAAPREATDPNMGMEEFARQHRAGKQAARDASRKGRGLN
jgi:hypothetical protein